MNSIEKPAIPDAVAPEPLVPLAAALRSGSLGLGDYIEKSLARVEAYDGTVRALLPEPGRRARLKAEAAALEASYPDPTKRPPLYGVLLGVKDIFAADGFETHAGSRLPPELFAMPQGPVVSALRRAGALVLGKTVTTEFAYFAPGPTTNPLNKKHTPGGSSSGSAAAVAAGFCSLALGTQTIGSISRPAAFCGIAGWKPSYERTSRVGVVPFSPSLDHVGFLAPDAASLAAAAPVVTGAWNSGSFATAAERFAARRPIIAIPDGPYLAQTEPAALAGFEAAVARLKSAGFSIVRVDALDDIEEINARHRRIAAAEMERSHRVWFRDHAKLYAEATRDLIIKGQSISDNVLELDNSGRGELRVQLENLLEESGAAWWLSPAATGTAPKGIDATGSPVMNLPWTHAGLPTVSLPSGDFVGGLPLGLQFAGPFGSDEALLALGVAVEHSLTQKG